MVANHSPRLVGSPRRRHQSTACTKLTTAPSTIKVSTTGSVQFVSENGSRTETSGFAFRQSIPPSVSATSLNPGLQWPMAGSARRRRRGRTVEPGHVVTAFIGSEPGVGEGRQRLAGRLVLRNLGQQQAVDEDQHRPVRGWCEGGRREHPEPVSPGRRQRKPGQYLLPPHPVGGDVAILGLADLGGHVL